MKAVAYETTGGPEVLQFRDLPDPVPGPGEVLVKVAACGVNRLDILQRTGQTRAKPPMPHVVGSEIAGTIAALGPQASGWAVGQHVAIAPYLHCGQCEFCLRGDETLCVRGDIIGLASQGGYAEYVKAPASSLVAVPTGVDFDAAAAVTLSTLTAYHMLVTKARVRPGETVLVIAAGSGVGSAAVQVAKLCGAHVIASAGSDEKLRRARELGADDAINYRQADLFDEVRRLTGKRGVDVVFEHVGAETWPKSVASLARGGRLVTCGALTGNQGPVDIWVLFAKELQLIGSYGGTRAELQTVLRLVRQGRIEPVIHCSYPLREAAQAQIAMENREQFGKLILKP